MASLEVSLVWILKKSCAWWETLRYLLRSLLGWRNLPAGLDWWYEDDKPSLDDSRLKLVLDRWDTRGELDYFAAREWETGGHSGVTDDEPKWLIKDYEPSHGWLRELQSRPPIMDYAPYGGGYNPLHLGP